MNANEVAELQQFLNSQGAGLKVDGSLGPRTRHAIEQFQRAAGTHADGIVGRRTQAAIDQTQQMPLPRANPMAGGGFLGGGGGQSQDPGMMASPQGNMGGGDPGMMMAPRGLGAGGGDPGIQQAPSQPMYSPPPAGQRPRPMDGDPTQASSPDFQSYIQAQILAQQSQNDRNNVATGHAPAWNTGARPAPGPAMDGSSMATANSPWAGGDMGGGGPSPTQVMDAKQRLAAALLGRR